MTPTGLVIRSYQVGFGDCFLLSFQYDRGGERHVLVDFGTMKLPPGSKNRMREVAKSIAERCGEQGLTAVVATHRHKDHISGFSTASNGAGPGDIIRKLKPKVVLQPWTEDPQLGDLDAPAQPVGTDRNFARAVGSMQAVSAQIVQESKRGRYLFQKAIRDQLNFIGEDNISNPSAVENLMTMAPQNRYLHAGMSAGLGNLLPGITVHVLGPPTVAQTKTVKTQRHTHPEEFWHLQARAMQLGEAPAKTPRAGLFAAKHIAARAGPFPINARWLIAEARKARGAQLLQIVRLLDNVLNNTSLILLVEIGDKAILLPGDAQWENWAYALGQEEVRELLKRVDVYKVGHHGSLNATPKSLWKLFEKRSARTGQRMTSLMSTLAGFHGHEEDDTEVPRKTLVNALERDTDHFSTQHIEGGAFWFDTRVL